MISLTLNPLSNLVGTFNAAGSRFEAVLGKPCNYSLKDKTMLERLACDRNTPGELLEKLAHHPIADVRAAVSDNENAPLQTLWTLARDNDADVRCQLAENHNLPLALIRHLADDENPYVACRAQKTYNRLRAS